MNTPEQQAALESDSQTNLREAETLPPREADRGAASIARALLQLPKDDAPPHQVRLGAELTLGQRLGAGSMGVVYAATAANPRRTVALKLLRPEFATREAIRRLKFEAEVLSRLDHPNIARVIGSGVAVGESGDLAYLVTELVAGAKTIVEYAAASCEGPRDCVSTLLAAARAVAHAHERGTIHRDLKPANILVSSAGEVKVIDFGLAKVAFADLAESAMPSDRTGWVGTARYLAPELRGGTNAAGTRSDVFALGLVLQEMLEQTALSTNPTAARRSPLPRRDCRDLRLIIDKAIATDPRDRYASAGLFAEDLQLWMSGRPPAAAEGRAFDALARLFRCHWRSIAASTASILLASSVAIAIILGRAGSAASSDANLMRHVAAISAAAQAMNSNTSAPIFSLLESRDVDAARLETRVLSQASSQSSIAVRLQQGSSAVAFFGRNHLLLIGTRCGHLLLTDPRDGRLLWSLPLTDTPIRIDSNAESTHILVTMRHGHAMLLDARNPCASLSIRADSAALSPDASSIAVANESTISILSTEGRKIGSIAGVQRTKSLRWSPFGDSLAISLAEREAVEIALDDFGLAKIFLYRFGAVSDIRWLDTPGTRAALVETNGPLLWRNGATRALNPATKAGGAEVIATGYRSRLLAIGSGLGRVTVADYEQGPPLLDIVAHRGTVTALEISPDGTQVVSAGADGFVRLWDLDPAAEAARRDPLVPLGVRSRVGHVSERHPFVTLATEDGRVATIDVLDRTEVFSWRAPDRDPSAVGGSPDQRRFAVGFASGEVWYADRDGCAPFLLAAEPGQVCAVEWLDEQRVAILWETGTFALLDASEGRRLWQQEFGAAGLRVSLAARRILRTGPDELAVLVASDTLDAVRCSISGGSILARIHGRSDRLISDRAAGISLEADGATLSIVTSSGDGYRWPRRGAARVLSVDPAPPPVALASATPDPERIALLSRTGMLTLVDPRSGRAMTTLSTVLRPIAAAGFTAHRESLVVVGLDGMVRVLPTRDEPSRASTRIVGAEDAGR